MYQWLDQEFLEDHLPDSNWTRPGLEKKVLFIFFQLFPKEILFAVADLADFSLTLKKQFHLSSAPFCAIGPLVG